MGNSLGAEQRAWKRQAEHEGWEVRLNERGHLIFVPPETADDRRPIPVPGRGFKKTNRGLKNAKAQLRRRGLDV